MIRNIVLALCLVSVSFCARVEFFDGRVVWGHTMTKDGLISINSDNGLFQMHMSKVKSIRGFDKEWIVTGEFVELRKEADHTSDIHFRLYAGTSLRRQGGSTEDFHAVKVYDTVGYVATKSVSSLFEQSAPLNPEIELTTPKGVVVMELFEDVAPNTVANFVELVEKNFYNGLVFHRVDDGFLVMGGDPAGTGDGGPGYAIKSELGSGLKNLKGYVGMGDKGVDTAGSQFYILLADAPHLDGRYSVFGKVSKGMKTVKKLAVGDEISEMKVLKKRDHDYNVIKLDLPKEAPQNP